MYRAIAVFLLLTASLFAQSFSKTDYPVGSEPRGIVTGDFNGDGVADIAVTSHASNSISLLLGRGDGSFNAAKSIAVTSNPTELVSADFNGDGRLDIAVAGDSVTILLSNGDGSFRRADVSGAASSITAGDFTGDGKPDLATVSAGKVQIFLNNGDGSFRAGSVLSTDVPAAAVRAADLNRDGSIDLAIGACCQGSDVTYGAVFIATGKGDGTFSVAKFSDVSDGSKLTVADATGDGAPDLIMPYVGCHTPCHGVELATNNGSGGFTRFGGAGDSGLVLGGPGQAVVADFNGDGKAEVATPFTPGDYEIPPSGKGYDRLYIWTVGADGKFSNDAAFALGTNTSPYAVAVGDFNHDGKPDIAVVLQSTAQVAVLLNNTGAGDARPNFELTVEGGLPVKAGDKAQIRFYTESTNGPLPQLQYSCSGLPQGAACSFDPSSWYAISMGFATITTTPRTTSALHTGYINFFALLLPFGFVAIPGRKRRRMALLLIALLAVAVAIETGCGGVSAGATQASNGALATSTPATGAGSGSTATGGGSGSTGGGTTTGGSTPQAGPTPAGTYQVTITASGGGVTKSQAVTLVVQ